MTTRNSSSQYITIIIPTLNNTRTLRNTLNSIIEQSYSNYELIIIDGGSDDGTTEIIKEYESHISFWISEKDKGVYDAMNKGIDQSKGSWILLLGADDILHDNKILERVFSTDVSGYYLLYGNVIYDKYKAHNASFGKMLFLKNTIHHQGTFYSRKCFDNFRFNTDYKVLSDYELNLKIYREKRSAQKLNLIISKCAAGGISKKFVSALYKEELRIKRSFFSWYWHPFIFIWVWLKFLYKSVLC